MSRLYDRIMRDKRQLQHLTAHEIEDFENAAVIVADNVREYSANTGRIDGSNLINIAPPFRLCFVEHKINRTNLMPRGGYFGALMIALNKDEIELYGDKLPRFRDEVKWAVLTYEIIQAKTIRNGSPLLWSYVIYGIAADGSLVHSDVDGEEGYGDFASMAPNDGAMEGLLALGTDEALLSGLTSEIYISLMAINFMHAKNVELIEEAPLPKLSKSHEKKYGQPLISYKVLKIHSMRKEHPRADGEPDASRTGLNRLHIARGHFKDYRDGPGLFGKHQEIYWWDQHVRGNAKHGAIVKDYDVQAPQD